MTSGRTARVQDGERNSRRDVRPATDGKEDTGGTGHMALGFVDLDKKAFDTVPREMVMVTLRWMGVPEAEVRTVEGVTKRQQQEWWWEKEHRRSLRSRWTQPGQRAEPAAVHILYLISRNTVMKDAMKKLLYADDLVLVANGKQELQETLEE